MPSGKSWEYVKWRDRLMDDDYKCEAGWHDCQKDATDLAHILPVREWLMFEMCRWNVVRLCRSCHLVFDRTGVPLGSQSPEHRKALSAAKKGVKKPDGFGAKVSAGLKGKPKTPEHVESIRAAQNRPEVRAKRAMSMKRSWEDPGVRERRVQSLKSVWT